MSWRTENTSKGHYRRRSKVSDDVRKIAEEKVMYMQEVWAAETKESDICRCESIDKRREHTQEGKGRDRAASWSIVHLCHNSGLAKAREGSK